MGVLRADRSSGGRATRGSRRRVAWLVTLAAGPIAALACSDDDDNKGRGIPDPGGTFGAEITIEVRGRGRVTANLPGIDCPATCFAKYVYPPGTSTPGQVTLKASPTPGANFRGWSFKTDPIPARGRGPDNCNPVFRPASTGTQNGLEVTLPYGEVTGTPPVGQEASCNGQTTVPFAYKVIAEFDPVIDAGRDAGETIEVVYEPVTGASSFSARDVGLVEGTTLYWHSTALAGGEIIARGEIPRGGPSQAPSTAATTTSTILLFEVDRAGVVYQTTTPSELHVIRGVGAREDVNNGAGHVCSTASLDSSGNLYCKTSSTGLIVTWAPPYTSAPVTLYSGLSAVNDILVETSAGPIYVTTSTSISTVPVGGNDGGAGTLTPVFSSRSNPRWLESNADRFFWLESFSVFGSAGKAAAGAVTNTSISASSSFQYLAEDLSSTQHFWVAGSSTIYHAHYQGQALTKLFLGGLSSITGMTADTEYVYYTTTQDSRVRRASRAGF
jgi:hypothetical protein